MTDWKATPEIRFVDRIMGWNGQRALKQQVLQQNWERQSPVETDTHYAGEWAFEWRDVPLVEDD